MTVRLADIEASQRATAQMLGVSHVTIQNDLNGGKKLPKNADEHAGNGHSQGSDGKNLPGAWFEEHNDETVVVATTPALQKGRIIPLLPRGFPAFQSLKF